MTMCHFESVKILDHYVFGLWLIRLLFLHILSWNSWFRSLKVTESVVNVLWKKNLLLTGAVRCNIGSRSWLYVKKQPRANIPQYGSSKKDLFGTWATRLSWICRVSLAKIDGLRTFWAFECSSRLPRRKVWPLAVKAITLVRFLRKKIPFQHVHHVNFIFNFKWFMDNAFDCNWTKLEYVYPLFTQLVYNGCQKLMAGIHGPIDSLQAMLQLIKMQYKVQPKSKLKSKINNEM